ncbi:hypothetical protein ACFSBZ_05810 [Amnibacterium flavum]|uniref:Uncharacterized protein n=1 Tax=Amnibacterium flavum TaxID=2173173 RepID=A0A2V1HNE3_9MICO|nr:hypothetical protein [Amnibacterium flavum]PVZ94015.1 hypothetical protein DDQ50_09670 [Amnibacterium flavum]
MIQLGTRWPFGGEPPENLGIAFADAVREVEAEVRTVGVAAGAPDDGTWTLTWLERRPTASLDVETVTEDTYAVTADTRGTVTVLRTNPTQADDDDAW